MKQCNQCGAHIPGNSKFCLQCGTEVPPGNSGQPKKELAFLKPALTGGLALGVLSSIPLIQAGNYLCCMWVLGGGGLAAYLLNKQRPGGLQYGDGALVGVMSGLIGALVATAVSLPIQVLVFSSPDVQQAVQQALQQAPADLPPAVREMLTRLTAPGFNASRALLSLIFYTVVFSLFAMIGGIVGVAVMNRRPMD